MPAHAGHFNPVLHARTRSGEFRTMAGLAKAIRRSELHFKGVNFKGIDITPQGSNSYSISGSDEPYSLNTIATSPEAAAKEAFKMAGRKRRVLKTIQHAALELVREAYLPSHFNPVLHPHVVKGRRGGGEFARKSGHLRDAVGEFASPTGEWKSTLDRHLIDYNHGIPSQGIPPRPLSRTTATEHVQRIFRGSTHVDYSETPFFKQLEQLQGTPNPGRMNAQTHADARDALFAKQPVEMVPTKGLILTQPNVNRTNVVKMKAFVGKDPSAHPAYVVRYGGKLYVMDGHHRLAAGVLNHMTQYPARVLDLDKTAKAA